MTGPKAPAPVLSPGAREAARWHRHVVGEGEGGRLRARPNGGAVGSPAFTLTPDPGSRPAQG